MGEQRLARSRFYLGVERDSEGDDMSQHTPDAWIECNKDDPDDPYSEIYRILEGYGESDEPFRCDHCETPMKEPTESGCCFLCDLEWMAAHQLTGMAATEGANENERKD